jgi:hypothetical protein
MGVEESWFLTLGFAESLWNSTFFSVVKFLVAIYVVVLFLDVLMLLFLRGVKSDYRMSKFGADAPEAYKVITLKQWSMVERHLKKHNEQDWKIAILEADAITNRVLELAGLPGKNFRERVEKSTEKQLSKKKELMEVHELRNTIIHDPSLSLDEETAKKTVEVYRSFLKGWEAI